MVLNQGKIMMIDDTRTSIDYYLNTQQNQTVQSKIGDERFTLLKAHLPKTEISTDDNISIVLFCEILKKIPNLRIGFDLSNSQGVMLFRSWHDDSLAEKKIFQPGKYRFIITIPGKLLKPDKYRISIEVGIHNVEMIISESCFQEFTIINLGSVNQLYNDRRRPGLINPAICWETEEDYDDF